MRLMVSGIGKRNALLKLIKNEAKFFNTEIDLIGADSDYFPPARIDVDEFIKVPSAFHKDYLHEILAVLNLKKIDAFLTLIDPEIPILGFIDSLENSPSSIFLNPSRCTALICEDKLKFYDHIRLAGIEGIPTYSTPLKQYPFIKKDRRGSAASGFKIFDSEQNLKGENISKNEFIFQPFCDGTHYCVDAYYSIYSNELIDFCVKKVVSKKSGEAYIVESVLAEPFTQFIFQISKVFTLRGIVNFDIYDDAGTLRLMEINCRIGGNYPATHAMGCNLLRHMLSELINRKPIKRAMTNYEPGFFVSKYFEFSTPLIYK